MYTKRYSPTPYILKCDKVEINDFKSFDQDRNRSETRI